MSGTTSSPAACSCRRWHPSKRSGTSVARHGPTTGSLRPGRGRTTPVSLSTCARAYLLFERAGDRWGRAVAAQDLAYLLTTVGGEEFHHWHQRARRLVEARATFSLGGRPSNVGVLQLLLRSVRGRQYEPCARCDRSPLRPDIGTRERIRSSSRRWLRPSWRPQGGGKARSGGRADRESHQVGAHPGTWPGGWRSCLPRGRGPITSHPPAVGGAGPCSAVARAWRCWKSTSSTPGSTRPRELAARGRTGGAGGRQGPRQRMDAVRSNGAATGRSGTPGRRPLRRGVRRAGASGRVGTAAGATGTFVLAAAALDQVLSGRPPAGLMPEGAREIEVEAIVAESDGLVHSSQGAPKRRRPRSLLPSSDGSNWSSRSGRDVPVTPSRGTASGR